jgi:hypothetical protein
MADTEIMPPIEPEQDPGVSRRLLLQKSIRALATIGVVGAAIATSSRTALAGCCTDCQGNKVCGDWPPNQNPCGVK